MPSVQKGRRVWYPILHSKQLRRALSALPEKKSGSGFRISSSGQKYKSPWKWSRPIRAIRV